MLESLLSEYQLYSGLINKTSEARVEGLTATRDRAQQVAAINLVAPLPIRDLLLFTQFNPTALCHKVVNLDHRYRIKDDFHFQVNTLVGTATGKAVEEGEARGRVSRERQQLLQGDLLDKVFLHFI